MTLLSLLIVMALERLTSKSPKWHIHALTVKYLASIESKGIFVKKPQFVIQVLIALIPALLLFWVTNTLDSIFLVFLLNVFGLWVCLGCPVTRKNYKRYLKAADEGDMQACSLHSMSFGNKTGDLDKVADQLVFINYRQYAAVLIWFVIAGIAGVLFYSLLKEMQGIYTPSANCSGDQTLSIEEAEQQDEEKQASTDLDKLMHVLDWLPVRFTGLGFLIVGHFSRATSVWISSLFDMNKSSKTTLSEIATAAEDIDAGVEDCTSKPCTMVRLVKRNVSFLLVAVSILTMGGAVG